MESIKLRELKESDLGQFFIHQRDPKAQHMAAFIGKDPNDRSAFYKHWRKIIKDEEIVIRTILYEGNIIGHIAKFVMFDEPELTYWIDQKYWGQGIATISVKKFLEIITIRPLFAHAAKDNIGSIRVLEKNNFEIIGEDINYANARGKKIEEVIMKLE